MADTMKEKGILVTGVIGGDVHTIGLRVLEHALRDAGFKVVSLGVQVSQEEYINAAIETYADAILVSSIGGHGKIQVEGLKDKCIEAGLKDIIMYVGGQLLYREPWEDTEKAFKDMGFNRVYPPFTLPAPIIADLEKDIGKKTKKRH